MPVPLGSRGVPRDDPGAEAGGRNDQAADGERHGEGLVVSTAVGLGLDHPGQDEPLGPHPSEVGRDSSQVRQLEAKVEGIVRG